MRFPELTGTRAPRLRDRARMGAWGVAWLFAAVFRKPSLGGLVIAVILWLLVPAALVVEAAWLLQHPVAWWLVPAVAIGWVLLMAGVVAGAYTPMRRQRSYLTDDGTTIFRIRHHRPKRGGESTAPTCTVDNFCRSMRAPKGGALKLIESLHPQIEAAVDQADADVHITAARPALADRYKLIDPLLEDAGKAFPRGTKLYRPRKSQRDSDAPTLT